MHRRDVLRLGATALGAAVLGSSTAAAHPGPYRPYGSVAVDGAKEAVVAPDGTTVLVAATDGYAVVDVSVADQPEVVAERRNLLSDRDAGPLRGIYDVKLHGDRLIVVGPANTLPGALAGMLVEDVSDPANPETVAFYETDYPIQKNKQMLNLLFRLGLQQMYGPATEKIPANQSIRLADRIDGIGLALSGRR